MPQFKSLTELAKYVNQKAKESLKDEVAPEVKKQLQDNVEEMIYSYEPKQYKRTGQLKEQIDIQETNEGVAIVPTYIDPDTNEYVPSNVEYGEGYIYTGYGYAYEKPRPFVKTTKDDLRKSGQLTSTLKESLKGKGFYVK